MHIKAHCPNCGPKISAEVVAEFEDEWNDEHEQYPIWGRDHHWILQCRGCERVYFRTASIFSEDDPEGGPTITHWPPPEQRTIPRWLAQLSLIDRALCDLTREVYSAFNRGLSALTAIGIRSIFDRSADKLGVDPAITFEEKLDSLLKLGKIGNDDRAALAALADAGGAAAHRAWAPSTEELETMFDVIEGFLHRSFFVHRAVQELANKIPAKPKRVKKD
jgi:hypothetical protein